MIWIMLATLAVVFVVGFRVLTSGARKAIRRLSDRLNIDVVPVESMVDQMGKSAGDEFLRYLHRPDESHLQNAAQVLLIWQIVIVDGSEQKPAAMASDFTKSSPRRADYRRSGQAGARFSARNRT